MKFNFLCGLAAVTGGAQATKMASLSGDPFDNGFPVGYTKIPPHAPLPEGTLDGEFEYQGSLKDGIYENGLYRDAVQMEGREDYRLDNQVFQNEGIFCSNPICKKFCAATADEKKLRQGSKGKTCNACQQSLEGVAVTQSDNTIMSFIFGAEKLPGGRFDATMSIRLEIEN